MDDTLHLRLLGSAPTATAWLTASMGPKLDIGCLIQEALQGAAPPAGCSPASAGQATLLMAGGLVPVTAAAGSSSGVAVAKLRGPHHEPSMWHSAVLSMSPVLVGAAAQSRGRQYSHRVQTQVALSSPGAGMLLQQILAWWQLQQAA